AGLLHRLPAQPHLRPGFHHLHRHRHHWDRHAGLVLARGAGRSTMTAAQTGMVIPRPEPLSGSRAPAWWGMLCLIATEATLFVLLIFSYFYLRWESPRWPPEGIRLPDFTYIIPATVLLLGSSAPVI